MAIDGNSVALPVTLAVHGSQAPQPAHHPPPSGGNVLSQSGKSAIAAAPNFPNEAAKAAEGVAVTQAAARPAEPLAPQSPPPKDAKPAAAKPDPGNVVTALNKALNNSGRPDQFRLASSAGTPVIEQINPATGAIIGEYSAAEFPALAASAEAGGSVLDSTA